MAWTKSQHELKGLVLNKASGFETDVVLCEPLSGVSTVVRALARAHTVKEHGVTIIGVYAPRAWEAIISLSLISDTTGQGYVGRLDRALWKLSGYGDYGLTLLLEEAHLMPPREIEKLMTAFEWTADRRGLAIRAMLLCNHVSRWNMEKQSPEMAYPKMPERLTGFTCDGEKYPGRMLKSKVIIFSRAGLDEVRGKDVPSDLFMQIENMPAKVA
jgi:hypothetical protein